MRGLLAELDHDSARHKPGAVASWFHHLSRARDPRVPISPRARVALLAASVVFHDRDLTREHRYRLAKKKDDKIGMARARMMWWYLATFHEIGTPMRARRGFVSRRFKAHSVEEAKDHAEHIRLTLRRRGGDWETDIVHRQKPVR